MRSNVRVEPLDLADPSPADIEALERVRNLNAMDPREYLAFLRQFSAQHPPMREIPPYHEPFTLSDGPFPPPPSEIFAELARVLKKR